MRTMKMVSMATVLGLVLAPALASAQEPAAESTDPAEPTAAATPADTGTAAATPAAEKAPTALINIDVEAASAYVWRGINLYGEEQNSQNFSLFPSLTATFGGFSIGYFGGFQLTGDNKSAKLDGAVGAEQDLILKYAGAINDDLSYSAGLVYWIYPFADPDVTNVDTPMVIEPGISATYSTAVDLGLYLGYYRPIQSELEAGSFVYVSPSIAKSVPITADVALALSLAVGYKGYTNLASGVDGDRIFDLTLNAGATFPFSDMYITPQLHASFATRDDGVVPEAELGDQFVAWAGVHVGYNIGL